jgi:hypothetical protein
MTFIKFVIASEARQPHRMLSGYASSTLFYSLCIATRLPRCARNDKVYWYFRNGLVLLVLFIP